MIYDSFCTLPLKLSNFKMNQHSQTTSHFSLSLNTNTTHTHTYIHPRKHINTNTDNKSFFSRIYTCIPHTFPSRTHIKTLTQARTHTHTNTNLANKNFVKTFSLASDFYSWIVTFQLDIFRFSSKLRSGLLEARVTATVKLTLKEE